MHSFMCFQYSTTIFLFRGADADSNIVRHIITISRKEHVTAMPRRSMSECFKRRIPFSEKKYENEIKINNFVKL